MTKDQAQALVEYDHTDEIDHREHYSGRGMYGDTTHAVVLPNMAAFHEIVGNIMVSGDDEERLAISEFLGNIRTDSMGLSIVIY